MSSEINQLHVTNNYCKVKDDFIGQPLFEIKNGFRLTAGNHKYITSRSNKEQFLLEIYFNVDKIILYYKGIHTNQSASKV